MIIATGPRNRLMLQDGKLLCVLLTYIELFKALDVVRTIISVKNGEQIFQRYKHLNIRAI